MGSQAKRNSSFRFEIHNFSEKEAVISSPVFVSGGCEWYLSVQPKKDDILGLFLCVAVPESLGRRWKRKTSYQFVLLNQSDKELYKSPMTQHTRFCAKNPAWGFRETLPLRKLQEKGFLENEELIVEVYITSVEIIDGKAGLVSETKKTVDITGFQDYASQVTLVRKIFAEHPEIAEEFKPKNQVVKTEYMNILRNACSKLSELAEVGFKLDWLKSKLGEVSLESKKADDAERSRVQQLEERIKNLELMESGNKIDCLRLKLDEVSLERKKSYAADGSRVQQLEERVKNLELMESGYKDCLKSKLKEISWERKKSVDADGCRVQLLEQRMENLELMENSLRLDSLKSKLEEISLENKNADANGSQVQQLEDRVKDLEAMVSDLIIELYKEKAESSTDGFLLVDEVA